MLTYMTRFTCKSPWLSAHGSTNICKLQKFLYGLKQASWQWFTKLSSFIISHGFEQCKFNYPLFIKPQGSQFVVLLVYVDDILITNTIMDFIIVIKDLLDDMFKTKNLGPLKFFLGIKIAFLVRLFLLLMKVCSRSSLRFWLSWAQGCQNPVQ